MLKYVKAFTRDKLDLALVNFNILVINDMNLIIFIIREAHNLFIYKHFKISRIMKLL